MNNKTVKELITRIDKIEEENKKLTSKLDRYTLSRQEARQETSQQANRSSPPKLERERNDILKAPCQRIIKIPH